MSSIQLKPNVTTDVDEILKGIATLEKTDLEAFLKKVANLIVKKEKPSLSKQETDLFLIINKEFSDALFARYQELSNKMAYGKISKKEHQELLSIVQKMEKRDVERLAALIKLSQIRDITLDELMDDLGIKPAYVQ